MGLQGASSSLYPTHMGLRLILKGPVVTRLVTGLNLGCTPCDFSSRRARCMNATPPSTNGAASSSLDDGVGRRGWGGVLLVQLLAWWQQSGLTCTAWQSSIAAARLLWRRRRRRVADAQDCVALSHGPVTHLETPRLSRGGRAPGKAACKSSPETKQPAATMGGRTGTRASAGISNRSCSGGKTRRCRSQSSVVHPGRARHQLGPASHQPWSSQAGHNTHLTSPTSAPSSSSTQGNGSPLSLHLL